MTAPHPSNTEGHVAVVTGATGHLGQEVCRALAERGDSVVGVYHTAEERAERLGKETGALLLRADLRDVDQTRDLIERLREQTPRVDALVCAHGGSVRKGVLAGYDPEMEKYLWRLNIGSTQQIASALAKGMLRRRYGRIVLFGSRAGVAGMPGQPEYAAAKAGLSAWAASVAWELGPFGVTVNVVAPGAVRPAQDSESLYSAEDDERVAARTALRRLGEPGEIASVISFLSGPGASYISGQTLAVDGGARW